MHKLSVIVVLMACLMGEGWAEEAAAPAAAAGDTTPSPAAAPSANPRVEVYGDFPASVTGTWMFVINTFAGKDHGKDRYMSAWHIYRLSVQDKQWRLQELDRAAAPPAMAESILAANKTATKLEPSAESLKAVAAVVSQFRPIPEEDTFNKVVLRTADQFEQQQPKTPAYLQGAQFSIEILERPREGQASSGVGFYAKDVTPDKISGSSQTAVVAIGGGHVVPFAAEGVFTMHRLQ